jgi:hypothetical protein
MKRARSIAIVHNNSRLLILVPDSTYICAHQTDKLRSDMNAAFLMGTLTRHYTDSLFSAWISSTTLGS